MKAILAKIKKCATAELRKKVLDVLITASLSRIEIAGICPVGIAYAGILAETNPVLAFMGIALGNIGNGVGSALKYMLGFLTYMLIVLIRRFKKDEIKALSMGTAIFFSGLISMVWAGATIKNAILILPEAVFCGALHLLFSKKQESGLYGYFAEMIIIIGALSGIYGIRIPYLDADLSLFAALIFLMSISHAGGVPTAVLSGTVTGFMFFINKEIAVEMAGILAISAGLSAFLSKMGKFGTAVGFLSGMTIGVLYMGQLNELSISDIFLTPVMFAVLPDKLFVKAGSYISGLLGEEKPWEREIIAEELKTVARAVCDLGDGVKIFSSGRNADKDRLMYNEVTQRVCSGCRMADFCFSNDEKNTYKHIEELKETMDREGYLNQNNAPLHFLNSCIKSERFINEFSHIYEKNKQDAVYCGEVADDRKIIARQYGEISNVISALSEQLRTKTADKEEELLYDVNITVGKETKNGEEYSGDSIVHFKKDSKYYVILCDGMGSGAAAMEESSLTARLFEEFLSAGIEKRSAVSMINSALALKADRESFSSVDLLEIDLKTGTAEFLKIGSAQSYIKREKSVETVFSTALPIGILEDVEVKPQKTELFDGDVILMLSDGVSEAGNGLLKNEWIKRALMEEKNEDKLSKKIIKGAKSRSVYGDDVTNIVIKIKEKV